MQNKWRNIRDCYVRDLRRKNGEIVKSRGKRTRQYIHAGSLAFLDDLYVTRPSSTCSSKTDSENSHFILDNISKPFSDCNEEINCNEIKQETLEENLKIILEKRSLESDEDSVFFSTLLPTVRNLDQEQKVEFRLEVLQALRQIAAKRYWQPMILQSENLDIDFNNLLKIGSATGSIFSGLDFLALHDLVMSLRNIHRECSATSVSSLSSFFQLSSSTQ